MNFVRNMMQQWLPIQLYAFQFVSRDASIEFSRLGDFLDAELNVLKHIELFSYTQLGQSKDRLPTFHSSSLLTSKFLRSMVSSVQ